MCRTRYYHQAHKLRVLAITHPDKHRAIVKKRTAAKLRVIEARKTAAHKKAAGLGEPPSNDLMKVRNRFQMNTVGLDKVRLAMLYIDYSIQCVARLTFTTYTEK